MLGKDAKNVPFGSNSLHYVGDVKRCPQLPAILLLQNKNEQRRKEG